VLRCRPQDAPCMITSRIEVVRVIQDKAKIIRFNPCAHASRNSGHFNSHHTGTLTSATLSITAATRARWPLASAVRGSRMRGILFCAEGPLAEGPFWLRAGTFWQGRRAAFSVCVIALKASSRQFMGGVHGKTAACRLGNKENQVVVRCRGLTRDR
jgi:hypothetical protein